MPDLAAALGGGSVANDDFADAQTISGPSATVTGTNVGATKQTGEPNHAGDDGGKSVWYRWTAPATGETTIDTAGSNFDTLLAVYTGNAVNALTEIDSNDDVDPDANDRTSRVDFDAIEGTTYRIAVDGYNDGTGADSGAITLNIKSTLPNDDFADAQTISGPSATVTGTNVGATKQTGEPNHAGDDGGKSVWYRWTAPATGETTIDTAGSNFDTLLAVYTGNAVNALTEIDSNDDVDPDANDRTSRVDFDAIEGTTYRIAVDGYNDGTGADSGAITLHVAAPDPGDVTPPDTTITSGPSGTVTATSATFGFSSSEPGSSFVCSLDGASASLCTTPKTYTALGLGTHTFTVAATDPPGNTDPSPAQRTWTIEAPQPACDIEGTAGNDVLVGTNAAETICGFGGNDVIYGWGANDTIDGGGGMDRVSYKGAGGPVMLDLEDPAGTVAGYAADRYTATRIGFDILTSIERATGTSGNDLMRGTNGPNHLSGLAGRDRIFGYGGRDILLGGPERDLLDGGPGRDTCRDRTASKRSC